MNLNTFTFIPEIIEDMNTSLAWDFGYELSLGLDDIDEGAFALPIHTEDLLETLAEVMGYQSSEDMHIQHIEHLADLYL